MDCIKITALAVQVDRNGTWTDPRGTLRAALVEVAPGCLVHVALGEAGVLIYHGEHRVGIPMELLIAKAQELEPALRPEGIGFADAQARAARQQADVDHRARIAAKAAAKHHHPLAPIGGEGEGEGEAPAGPTLRNPFANI